MMSAGKSTLDEIMIRHLRDVRDLFSPRGFADESSNDDDDGDGDGDVHIRLVLASVRSMGLRGLAIY